jgi:hypothetical protein
MVDGTITLPYMLQQLFFLVTMRDNEYAWWVLLVARFSL